MIKIALQLYTVRTELERDFISTIAAVASAGYTGVEFWGNYFDIDAADMRGILDKYNLKTVSSEIRYEEMASDFFEHLNYVKALGGNYITVCSLPEDKMTDEMSIFHVAAELDGMARKAKQKGLSLLYRNGLSEFTTVFNGRCVEQILIDEAPNLNFEVDTGCAAMAGVDGREFLLKLGYRADLVYIRDADSKGRPVEIGDGRLSIKSVIDTANAMAIRWVVVGQETVAGRDPLESVRVNYENIQEKYIRFLER